MINVAQLKKWAVEPALSAIGLTSPVAVNLVTGTALAESKGEFLVQVEGPALGLWQMEPETENDCWVNYLQFHKDIADKVLAFLPRTDLSPPVRAQFLVYNLLYGAAMCRLKYYRSSLPMPRADDAEGLAEYHKRVYNSALGAADPHVNIPLFEIAIRA